MVRGAEVRRCRTGAAACTAAQAPGLARPKVWSGRAGPTGSTKAKRVRRDARQQYRLLRQLIAAGNEDEVLDLISSM
jgi:hypothetical protein